MQQQKLGITFSDRHAHHLGLPVAGSLKLATMLGFSHIRLGAYWSDLEVERGRFRWQSLIEQLEICERAQQPVVLVIGTKAPRSPEYYIPEWYSQYSLESEEFTENVLSYLKKLIAKVKKFSCITHWQVENEPFLPITVADRKLTIPESLLQKEIAFIKSLDSRPCIVSTFGNHLLIDGSLRKTVPFADVVGIDLYPKIFTKQILGRSWYSGIIGTDTLLAWQLKKYQQPIWIMELQAEPWEQDEAGYRAAHTKSISIEQLRKNLVLARSLPVDKTLLWGYEYWLWRAKVRGDYSYLQLIRQQT